MSPEEKLDLSLRSYAAFSAGPDIDALIPLYSPDCEWRLGAQGLEDTVYKGHDGLRDLAHLIAEAFGAFAVTLEEARIAADGRVLLRFRADIKSAVVGANVSQVRWQEGEFTDRQIRRISHVDLPPHDWDEAETLVLPEVEG